MTEVQIDSSCLPPVQEVCRDFAVLEDGAFAYCLQEQEIEQHYASNVQRNQLVQKDLWMAKSLQAMEDEGGRVGSSQDPKAKQSEERDCSPRLLPSAQDGAHLEGSEPPQREERDQDHTQQMEEQEGEKATQKAHSLQRPQGEPGTRDVAPQSPEQVRQDEELAWRLQEEEHARAARARRNRERNDDYRVAQVAQDEEIARYIQDQELQERWKSPSEDPKGQGVRGRDGGSPEPKGREEETPKQKSGRAPTPVLRVTPLEHPGKGSPTVTPTRPTQFCRNIAEELDPTFKAKGLTRLPAAEVTTTRSRVGGPLLHPVPVDGFFDYVDELAGPAFVSPTKRQPEKVGHPKPREKREGGCKHQ